VHDLVSEAIDGTLSPADARDFHAHLAACPPCRMSLGDVKESLTLLTELPAVEVGADFDEAVWRRIRAESRPSASIGLSARWRGWVESLRAAGGWLRWAPLGAAAAVLSWVLVSSDTAWIAQHSGASGRVAASGAETGSATASDASASGGMEVVETVAPEFTPVEFSAGIPQAVEEFLRSDGRLGPNRYTQSSYHYPIRPVRDPLILPVSTGATPTPTPDTRPMSTESGVPVLAF
jgi:hypothetical protein